MEMSEARIVKASRIPGIFLDIYHVVVNAERALESIMCGKVKSVVSLSFKITAVNSDVSMKKMNTGSNSGFLDLLYDQAQIVKAVRIILIEIIVCGAETT